MRYSKRVTKALLYERQRGRCKHCRAKLLVHELQIDHVIPRAGGGADFEANLQLLCGPCNRAKRDAIAAGAQYTIFDQPRTRLRVFRTAEDSRKRERDKKAKRRQWAREHGYCIICCKNAASFDVDGNPLATCKDCRDRVVANRKKG